MGAVVERLQAAQLVIDVQLTLDANIFQEIARAFDTHMVQHNFEYRTDATPSPSTITCMNAPWVILAPTFNASNESYSFRMPTRRQLLQHSEYTVTKLSSGPWVCHPLKEPWVLFLGATLFSLLSSLFSYLQQLLAIVVFSMVLHHYPWNSIQLHPRG